MSGPKTPFAQHIQTVKYGWGTENHTSICERLVNTIGGDKREQTQLYDALFNQRILFAGRVTSAIGSGRHVSAHNCYVSGVIRDSLVDEPGNIMQNLSEAAATLRMGGGEGYDFSTLRPRGAPIKRIDSASTGPLAFMEMWNSMCGVIASANHRRGAQMAMLRIDHPDILEYIQAKNNSDRLTNFNTSVAVTDQFMEALNNDSRFDLRFQGKVYKTLPAREIWDALMRSTYDWAEPGVFFVDRVNKMNNLWYAEYITTCNPCGEQPLPPHGACLLGSLNLVKYLYPMGDGFIFNTNLLVNDVRLAVRALDRVIDVAIYPLFDQQVEAKEKRRMGVGVTGVANAIEALGCPYGGEEFCEILGQIMTLIRDAAYLASTELAHEKGTFPKFQSQNYMRGAFIQTLPDSVKLEINKYGMRNSHLLSIAPTGTISLSADNVSSSIEPVFAYHAKRKVKLDSWKTEEFDIWDYGFKFLGVRGKTTDEVTIAEHVEVLSTAQKYVDSAVSKTLNVPKDIPYADFQEVYRIAWAKGAKGCTTYRKGCAREGILTEIKSNPVGNMAVSSSEGGHAYYGACTVVDGVRSCE